MRMLTFTKDKVSDNRCESPNTPWQVLPRGMDLDVSDSTGRFPRQGDVSWDYKSPHSRGGVRGKHLQVEDGAHLKAVWQRVTDT